MNNTEAVKDNQVITNAFVDQFHQKNEGSRQNLGIDFYDESNYLVKKFKIKTLTTIHQQVCIVSLLIAILTRITK